MEVNSLYATRKYWYLTSQDITRANATVGHTIPLSKGGEHTMQNVQLECMKCNVKKGNRIY